MGQRKGAKSKKSAVATIDESTARNRSEVVALRPADKSTKKTDSQKKSKSAAGPSHEQIARRAHELWLQNGGQHGNDQRYWLEAEAQLKKEMDLE